MGKITFLSIGERRILGICLAVVAGLSLLYFYGEQSFGDGGIFSDKSSIGKVLSQENDVRHRVQGDIDWQKARTNQALRVGDAIFSGAQSSSHVDLKKGGGLDIGENSLVVFNEIEDQKTANLMGGNFRLNVDGSVVIAINGELTRIEGKKSELQIFFEKGQKANFKILKGDVRLGKNKGPLQTLAARAVANVKLPAPAKPPPPRPEALNPIVYYWQLYDLYSGQGSELTEKDHQPVTVGIQADLVWSQSPGLRSKLQFAKEIDFRNYIESVSAQPKLKLQSAFLGQSYWRVSTDEGKSWSSPQSLLVTPQFIPYTEPFLAKPALRVPLTAPAATVDLDIRSPVSALGFVGEASRDGKFTAGQSQLSWWPGAKVQLSFAEAGSFYYRFRTVTENQQLSNWSATQRFDVVKPQPIQNRLVQQKKMPPVKQNTIHSRQELRKTASADRAPADPSTSSKMKRDEVLSPMRANEKYKDAQVSIEGYMRFLQSTEQHRTGQTTASAAGAGLRGRTWWDHHGIEGLFKSTVLGANEAGKQGSAQNIEGRYHYRFISGFPFGWASELQTSFFVGFETYRNTAPLYLSRYNIMKVGTSLEFPLWDRWSTGGELVYGSGTDKSSKKEISGHLNYYLSRNWSFGAGYRFHVLDAGEASAAPGDSLPYREGYAEAYSILNCHF